MITEELRTIQIGIIAAADNCFSPNSPLVSVGFGTGASTYFDFRLCRNRLNRRLVGWDERVRDLVAFLEDGDGSAGILILGGHGGSCVGGSYVDSWDMMFGRLWASSSRNGKPTHATRLIQCTRLTSVGEAKSQVKE